MMSRMSQWEMQRRFQESVDQNLREQRRQIEAREDFKAARRATEGQPKPVYNPFSPVADLIKRRS